MKKAERKFFEIKIKKVGNFFETETIM